MGDGEGPGSRGQAALEPQGFRGLQPGEQCGFSTGLLVEDEVRVRSLRDSRHPPRWRCGGQDRTKVGGCLS